MEHHLQGQRRVKVCSMPSKVVLSCPQRGLAHSPSILFVHCSVKNLGRSKNSFLCAMTLSISDQPSQWRRLSDHPKRLSLLSDATIDPFPQRVTRSASLLEHHIVRDSPLDNTGRGDDGRRSTVPFLPYRASPLGPELHHAHDPYYHVDELEEQHELSRKRNASMMADQPSGSSSPASVGQQDGQTQFCLCQPEPKIPRPRNGEHTIIRTLVPRLTRPKLSFFIANINKRP